MELIEKPAANDTPQSAPAEAAQATSALAPQPRKAPLLRRPKSSADDKKRKKRKGGSASREFVVFFDGLLSFLMVVALAAGSAGAYFNNMYLAPGRSGEDQTVIIPSRAGVTDISEILKQRNLIEDTLIFRVGAFIGRANGELKAGEYLIPKGSSTRDIIDILRSGQSIQYGVTIPEGLTSLQIVQRLRGVDVLSGDIRQVPAEGSLLPDTYRVTRGTSRESVLQIMQRAQRRVVDDVWKRRAAGLPLKSPDELVVLASIVEKETGKSAERARVAGVFVNRLNKRIRLQSDPTIIYGLVGGQGTLGRGLTRSEIDRATPYNTYVILGLPPTPIANPGREAIEAAANPRVSNELYFVADGTGGHAFSETLDQHQKAVARWRNVEKTRSDANDDDGAETKPPAPVQPPLSVRQAPRRPAAVAVQPQGANIR